jgi:adenylosuccinate lyase
MPGFLYEGEVQPPADILASRYASPDMVRLFSEENRVYAERGLWIAIMRAQSELGFDIPEATIEAYVDAQGDIDLASIREREKKSGHDVNSRIAEFNYLAGHQKIHIGMTSRDATENVEQSLILSGLELIQHRIVSTLGRFGARALDFDALPITARTHNVPAQMTTLGKRIANSGDELMEGYVRISHLIDTYVLRGIKGPVGTQQDILELLGGDPKNVDALERKVAEALGFQWVSNNVGQVYPRSSDFNVVTALKQSVAGPVNFSNNLRLMAGAELATEGFKPGQVGSNAMPHKMNTHKSERIRSLSAVLTGYVAMASELSGDQWNEGDVSCSAARRVLIPGSFFAADGLFQTAITVLDKFAPYPEVISNETERYLPFLTTTRVLMEAVRAGMGREDAHDAIKQHAVAAALAIREEGSTVNDLFDRLDADESIPVTKTQLLELTNRPLELTGLAHRQTERFVLSVQALLDEYPGAKDYQPSTVL